MDVWFEFFEQVERKSFASRVEDYMENTYAISNQCMIQNLDKLRWQNRKQHGRQS